MPHISTGIQSLCRAAATYCQSFLALQPTQFVLPASLPHSASLLHTAAKGSESFVALNNLSDNPGAAHSPKRVGRGTGSGLGKTAGRGHKGQKARTGRSPKLGFEGGQTPLRLRIGKRGFTNPFQKDLLTVNLDDIARRIEEGRLDPSSVATMHTLREAGLLGKKVHSGVKLLGRGAENFHTPLHLQVSEASKSAQQAVEKAGGSVTTVYYNQLGLRALLTPSFFARKSRPLPRPAGAPAKVAARYDQMGQIPPDTALPAQTQQ